MPKLLSVLFAIFALVVIAIGLGLFLAGPHATAGFFDRMITALVGVSVYETGLQDANTGSELRFFSVFWIAFGVIMWRFARDVETHRTALLVLLLIFFTGGIGRALAHASSGPPDLLFVALGWVELILPLALGGMVYFGIKPRV